MNGKSCLFALFKYLNTNRIWYPEYICPSIVFKDFNLEFYPVNIDLSVPLENINLFSNGDIILVPNYFGFSNETLIKACKEKSLLVIEDLCQSIFSEPSVYSDYAIYSLSKHLPLSDGGVIYSKLNKPMAQKEVYDIYLNQLFKIREKRARFDTGENNDWYKLYNESKSCKYIGDFKCSLSTLQRLNNIDLYKRRNVFQNNYKHLNLTPLINSLYPTGFLTLLKRRQKVLDILYKNNIFPAIHWNITNILPKIKNNYFLSDRLITIPIDQRYSLEEMERISDLIKSIN